MIDNKLEYFKKLDENFTTLYVEDNDELRKQTMKMLKSILPNVIESVDGKEGVEIYKKYNSNIELRNIDLVITDIQMPRKNGLDMIENIRALDSNIPIVIFSAYDKSDYFLEAINIGIDGYILKPYTLEQIADVLTRAINKYQSQTIVKLADDLSWCTMNSTLKQKDAIIKLSKNEIKLIDFLLSLNRGIKSSQAIENYIFDDFISDNKRVRGLISRFNSKFETNIIESVYAQGYRIKVV